VRKVTTKLKPDGIRLKDMPNIGPTIQKRLHEIGIYTKADLAATGAVRAYKMIQNNYPGKTIPVCYYLYSFQGALLNMHWDDLPKKIKDDLRKQVGKK
jgi:DNA transformation protein